MMRRLFGKLCIANRGAGRWRGGTAVPPDLSGFDCSHRAAPGSQLRRAHLRPDSALQRYGDSIVLGLSGAVTSFRGGIRGGEHGVRTVLTETSAEARQADPAPRHRSPCLPRATGQARAKRRRPCSSSCIRSAPARRRDGRRAPATLPGKSPSASGRSSPASIFPRKPGR